MGAILGRIAKLDTAALERLARSRTATAANGAKSAEQKSREGSGGASP